MWIMSGIFFSTARFPDAVLQPAVQALPLTAINDALRAVMIDGSSLLAVWGELAIAGGWALASFDRRSRPVPLVLAPWRTSASASAAAGPAAR